MTISGGSALPKEEIDRMVREAEEHAEEDKQRREEAETRNTAEQLVYSTEKFLADNDDKLPDEGKGEVRTAVDELKTALAGDDIAEVKAKHETLSTASQKLGSALYEAQQPSRPPAPRPPRRRRRSVVHQGLRRCSGGQLGRRRRRRRRRDRRRRVRAGRGQVTSTPGQSPGSTPERPATGGRDGDVPPTGEADVHAEVAAEVAAETASKVAEEVAADVAEKVAQSRLDERGDEWADEVSAEVAADRAAEAEAMASGEVHPGVAHGTVHSDTEALLPVAERGGRAARRPAATAGRVRQLPQAGRA